MENIIVREVGSITGLTFSKEFMALVIFIICTYETKWKQKLCRWMLSSESLRIDSLLS